MTTCKSCNEPCNSQKTIIVQNRLVEGCDNCLPDLLQQGHEGSAKFNREYQRKQFRKDLTQPNQKEFFKAYPEKAREMYGDEAFRKYG